MGSYRGWERDNQASDGEFFVQIRALTLLKYAGVLAAIIIVNLIYQRFVNKTYRMITSSTFLLRI